MESDASELDTDYRIAEIQNDISTVLEKYYPEVKFLRDLFLFESFPVTIIFYIIVHLTFYFLLVTENSPLSLLVFFLSVGYAAGKLAKRVVLPNYLAYRIREINKRGRNKVEHEEQQQYIERLSRRLSHIKLFIDDCNTYVKTLREENHTKYCILILIFGFIVFIIGWYIPGYLIGYLVILFILIWPIIVHNKLPRHLAGIQAVIAPYFHQIKHHAVEGVKKIPHPSPSAPIDPTMTELSPQEMHKAEKQFLEQSIAMTPSLNLYNPPNIMGSTMRYNTAPYHPDFNEAPLEEGAMGNIRVTQPPKLDLGTNNGNFSDYDVVEKDEISGYTPYI